MRIPERPAKDLTIVEIEAFRRDGVICVRQLYSPQSVERIRHFLDDVVSNPSPVFGPRGNSSFQSDITSWLTNDDVRDFVLFGPSAHIAQQAFGSQRVVFYSDQIFVKDKLSPQPTAWHHDLIFWPMAGEQIASIWTSVDPVDASSSALEFVAGSHLWPQRFSAIAIDGTDLTTGMKMDEIPDIDSDRSKFDILSWELEAGDALLFHALTLHGSRGNHSKNTKRRAIATRWCGDDVVYTPTSTTEIHRHDLKVGDPFCADIFPQVLPEILEDQISARMNGPVMPDGEMMGTLFQRFAHFDKVEVVLDA